MGKKGGDGGAGAAMQQALNNQSTVNNQLLKYISDIANQNTQYYQAPLAGEASAYGGAVNALTPGFTSGLATALNSGGNLSGQTGINTNQLGQNLVNYASQPGKTNLAQTNPGLMNFFQGEMQNGLNPAVVQSAQGQVQQNLAQQLSDARAQAAPGQNMNALEKDLRNQALASSANLAGNLAGQSQGIMQQGAQGVQQQASGLDQQTLNMLSQALSQGGGVNQQALQNLMGVLGLGQTSLNNATSFTGQGQSGLTSAMGALGGISNQMANQAASFAQEAGKQQSSGGLLGGLLGTVAGFLPGGQFIGAANNATANPGGLGNVLSKL